MPAGEDKSIHLHTIYIQPTLPFLLLIRFVKIQAPSAPPSEPSSFVKICKDPVIQLMLLFSQRTRLTPHIRFFFIRSPILLRTSCCWESSDLCLSLTYLLPRRSLHLRLRLSLRLHLLSGSVVDPPIILLGIHAWEQAL